MRNDAFFPEGGRAFARGETRLTIVLGLVFALSGVAGLLFETLWFRMAGLTIGSSVWASSLVLASFMGGLAMGNALAARYGHRLRRPLVAYAVLEGIVGLLGFGLVVAFPRLPALLAPLFAPLLDQPVPLNVLRFGISFTLLLIPTTSMGLTLPLMVKALNRRRESFGPILGHLYGLNTLGAMVGAVLGELLLIEVFGIRGTGLVAAGLNFISAALALVCARLWTRVDAPSSRETPGERRRLSLLQWRILIAAFVTGGALLALEVVWFRFLQLFVHSTGRSFAIMLLIVLMGIGIGGLLSSACLRFFPGTYRLCRHLTIGTAILVLWSYVLFADTIAGDVVLGSQDVWGTIELSARLMLPVSVMSGILFTFLGRAFWETWGEETRAVGLVTLANTLGATVGAVAGAWLLLPVLGIERSLFAVAIAYAAIGLLLPLQERTVRQTPRFQVALALAALACLLSLGLFPFGLMKNHFIPMVAGRYAHDGSRILAYEEGLGETIIYTQSYWMGEPYAKRLLTNAYTMSGIDLPPLRYMKYFVYWPLAFHPEVDKALLISYGVGSTAKGLTDSREIDQIDIVDISREILESSRIVFPEPSESPLNDPRVRVFVEDGRFFMLTTDETYDLITAEPPPPGVSGVVNLYTLEYFQLLYERLNEGGYATYWLPLETLSMGDAKAIVRAFCSVFGDCSLWRGAKLEMVMVGSRNARGQVDERRFERQWRDPEVARELEILGFETPELLLSTFVADSPYLEQWTAGALPLTDNFPRRLRGDLEAEPEQYLRDLGNAPSQKRFGESRLLKERLPRRLFDAGLALYDYQAFIDGSLDRYPAPSPLDVEKLHQVLTETELRTPVLWLLGDLSEFSGVVQALAARHVESAEVELHLGFRKMANREYREAAAHFERAHRLSGNQAGVEYYRILALAYAGERHEAEKLAMALRASPGRGNDAPFWEFCSRRLGLSFEGAASTL